MKVSIVLAAVLSGVAFAEVQAAQKGQGFKDLTNLKYDSNELPVAEAVASVERRETAEVASHEAPKPVKDNRKLRYNADTKMPLADAAAPAPERREEPMRREAAAVASHEAPKPVKDNRKLRYNADTKMPLAMASAPEASVERRETAEVASHEAPKPVKDNRKLRYNTNSKMPIAESE